MTKKLFNAIDPDALFLLTNRLEEENKKLKEQLTVSEEQRALLSDLNKEQERTIASLVEEALNIKMAQN